MVQQGSYQHTDPSILIQITDPGTPAPIPKHDYVSKHHFIFHDAERDRSAGEFPYVPKVLIGDKDAEQIISILRHALDNDINVVVHCHAGICRSGAVVEVAEMMGFDKCDSPRIPNTLVKHKLMKQLGWTYD